MKINPIQKKEKSIKIRIWILRLVVVPFITFLVLFIYLMSLAMLTLGFYTNAVLWLGCFVIWVPNIKSVRDSLDKNKRDLIMVRHQQKKAEENTYV